MAATAIRAKIVFFIKSSVGYAAGKQEPGTGFPASAVRLIKVLDVVVILLRIGRHVQRNVYPFGGISAVRVQHLECTGIVAVHVGQ